MDKILHRLYLTEDQMPQKWFNLRSAMAKQPDPLLHPGVLRPSGMDDLSPIFCEKLTRQELGGAIAYVDIPEPIQNVYKMYRSFPLIRAYELGEALDIPVKIYYKFKGSNTSGPHKLNSAVTQAYYAKMQGLTGVTTETGADRWGTTLSKACGHSGLTCDAFIVRCSYEQEPFRRAMMSVLDTSTTLSPSPTTEVGRQILCDHSDTTGSLGCTTSEAVELVAQSGDVKRYVLGNVSNQVFPHQSIIGLESKLAMEQLGEYPDMVVGCTGGGPNLGRLTAPFTADKLRGIQNSCIVAMESASYPSPTRGKHAYDFCDTGRVTPLARMYTSGYGFIPSANHADGLCYHGTSPILFKFYHDGYIEAVVYEQTHVFEAAVLLTKREIILPVPESAHVIRGVIDETLRCRKNREAKTILPGPTGTGYFDMIACENHPGGKVSDSIPTDTDPQRGFDSLPKIPQGEGVRGLTAKL